MGESQTHIDFVKRLHSVATMLLNEQELLFLYLDVPNEIIKPQRTFENFYPDMFYASDDIMIIGEAKTANDIDRKHSMMQYESYFHELSMFSGRSIMVFSVPWYTKNTIKNIARRLRKKYSKKIEVYIVSDIEGVEVL